MSGSNTSSQTSGISPEFAGILSQFGGAASQAMGMPYQQYQGPRVAELSGVQNQALGGYQDLLGGNPGFDATYGMLTDTLNGQGGNPFTEQVVNRATQASTDAFNRATRGTTSAFNSAGGLGSARHQLAEDHNQQNLARGLGDATGALYSNAYESERGRQMQAAGLTGSLASTASGILGNAMQAGDIPRRQDQQIIDAMYGDWQRANDYPWTQLERGAGLFGALQGGMPRTTTTTGPGRDPVAQGLGAMALMNYAGYGNGGGKSSGGSVDPWTDGSAYMV